MVRLRRNDVLERISDARLCARSVRPNAFLRIFCRFFLVLKDSRTSIVVRRRLTNRVLCMAITLACPCERSGRRINDRRLRVTSTNDRTVSDTRNSGRRRMDRLASKRQLNAMTSSTGSNGRARNRTGLRLRAARRRSRRRRTSEGRSRNRRVITTLTL